MSKEGRKTGKKLLATGSIRTVEKDDSVSRKNPVLYWFPGSFNSGKATLAMQLSSRSKDCTLKKILHMKDNYTPEYARLNPDTMAVPTLEIDDKVCTDSYDLCLYLMEHYPGSGDQALKKEDNKEEALLDWINLCSSWDEYMYTYGHQSQSQADMANSIRLFHLRKNLDTVLSDQPNDMNFLVDCYVTKIAGVTVMKRAMEEGTQKDNKIKENKLLLDQLLAKGNELLKKNGGKSFLFGEELTTGDVFFLPIFRIFALATPNMFEQVYTKYPKLKTYWEKAKKNIDVKQGLLDCVLPHRMIFTMFSHHVPFLLLSYKLGFMSAQPELPEEIEKRITELTKVKWDEVCAGE